VRSEKLEGVEWQIHSNEGMIRGQARVTLGLKILESDLQISLLSFFSFLFFFLTKEHKGIQ
jgi:hypothetical protein